MKDDLKGKVTTWLETQGYPLEMKVTSALRKVGFNVNQGEYYDDPETKTTREIDVIALKGDDYGVLEISFVVECKKSIDKPWVLFTSDKHESGKNKFFTYSIMSELAREKLSENVIDKMAWDLLWLRKPERTAYGMSVAFAKGEDPAYKAVLSALKASIDQNKTQNDTSYSRSLRFIFPVIVLEGKLFESYLDPTGKILVQEIEEGVITYYRSIAGFHSYSVRIFTVNRLTSFCQEALEVTKQLENLLKTDIEEMRQYLTMKKGSKRGITLKRKS